MYTKDELVTIIEQTNRRIQLADLELLTRACEACEAKTILEIGSADGGSAVVLAASAAERGGHLTCIETKPKQRMVDNLKARGLDNYTLIKASSPWLGADLSRVPDELDLLFIDGRHDIRWALVDYHVWSPRVRPGGVVVFHDTGGGCKEDRSQPDWGLPGYVPLVQRAVEIVLSTDALVEIDRSDAAQGGARAFRTPGKEAV